VGHGVRVCGVRSPVQRLHNRVSPVLFIGASRCHALIHKHCSHVTQCVSLYQSEAELVANTTEVQQTIMEHHARSMTSGLLSGRTRSSQCMASTS
jgi:hypothetical protein